MRAMSALALLLLATPARAQPVIPPATIDNTLEITGETVRARMIETRLSVPVRIDAQGPFRFIVDSGADRSVVGAALARRLGLPAVGLVLLQGMAGPSMVQTVRVDALSVGHTTIPGIVAPALAEADLGADGIIGIDALAEQRVRMDFDAKSITVEDARRPEPYSNDAIVVTARRSKGQLILTELDVGIGRIYAVIDTGAEVTMGNPALRARIFAGRTPPAVTPVVLTSVTGQTLAADLIIFPQIRLGGLTLANVPVAFADAPPFRLFGLSKDPAMLLGTDVLGVFRRVSLDFRRRKVRFVLRR
jgi:predicted aspartyl protease